MKSSLLTESSLWVQLSYHAHKIKQMHIRDLFKNKPERGTAMHQEINGLQYNFCREKIDAEGMKLLFAFAKEEQLKESIDAMFRGDKINITENRSVLHTALRLPKNSVLHVDGKDIVKKVHLVLDQMTRFAEDIYQGNRLGFTGKKIKYFVNIGIGGSDLGSKMAMQALTKYIKKNVEVRFLSNVDPTDFAETIKDILPEETLFIICSKKFTTEETLANAHAAKKWITTSLGEKAIPYHFVAISANIDLVTKFGIKPENIFEMWDWVGGRFSVSSAVGLSLMLGIGPDHFKDMLNGMHDMDNHYKTAPYENNIPVIMALLSIWNTTFLNNIVYAPIMYDVFLKLFPKHLQQLLAESLGKSVNIFSKRITYQTSPVVMDAIGTDFEHSFNQLIHMGMVRQIALTFISCINSLQENEEKAQSTLLAHMFAQADSLAFGVDNENLHKSEYGDVPSSLLLIDKLTPYSLGQLIALFEHQVHAQATLLQINGFDQFGVEAGKKAATQNILRFAKDGFTPKTIENMLKKQY